MLYLIRIHGEPFFKTCTSILDLSKIKIETHVNHRNLGVCLPWSRWPPNFNGHPYSLPAGAPYLFDKSSQKEKISPGIPSFTRQTSKIWKACINFLFILAAVLIRNLIPHRRRTIFPYGLFSYVHIISRLESKNVPGTWRLMLHYWVTSCVANYIIVRSMKEGKGSQCQEGKGAYQEPQRSSLLSLRNQSSIIIHHHLSSPSFIIIIHHHPSSKSSSISHLASSSIIIIYHHHPSLFTSIIIHCHPSSSTIMIHDHDPSSSSTTITVIIHHHNP